MGVVDCVDHTIFRFQIDYRVVKHLDCAPWIALILYVPWVSNGLGHEHKKSKTLVYKFYNCVYWCVKVLGHEWGMCVMPG